MIRVFLILALSTPVAAQTVVATQPIPSRSVVTALDVEVVPQTVPGAASRLDDVIGLEARVTLYPGRPIRMGDVGPPALIERNEIVTLRFISGGLRIETDGRALERAGAGDMVRVMNTSSRTTVTGRVLESGVVEVGR
ncbi:MAG: flagellar basal body P-ring formation chaperone FlgA [Pseudomonadota bacterium]